MANYYTDHPEIEFHLNHPLMKRVVDLKERNYVEKDQFEDAPVNYEDAIENYKRLLDITGDVLNLTRDSASDIYLRMNGNTSLTNLTVVIYPTCIYCSTGSTYLTMEIGRASCRERV